MGCASSTEAVHSPSNHTDIPAKHVPSTPAKPTTARDSVTSTEQPQASGYAPVVPTATKPELISNHNDEASVRARESDDVAMPIMAAEARASQPGPRFSSVSARSSFATERDGEAGGGLGNLGHAKARLVAGAQAGMTDSAAVSVDYTPTDAIAPLYKSLGVLPSDMPAPLSMLQKLWNLPDLDTAMVHVHMLRDAGVLRVAVLEDGSSWCLVEAGHLAAVQTRYGDAIPARHAAIVDAYTNDGALALKDVPDDGYIVQNLSHHLLGAGRTGELRDLLCEPAWLEAKLHAYGIASIVQDFRRYLGEMPGDTEVKLLLQAFQLSLGCCMEHPTARMLREQMLARLISVSQVSSARAALTTAGVMGRASSASNGRASCLGLHEWFQDQSSKVAADLVMAAGYTLVHLMPRSASLVQAGGLNRMTLRGHTLGVRKVVISPNGQDVITVSEDGSAQVWDMNVGDCVMQLARDTPLTDVDVAPGGGVCAVASQDGHCCVWDLGSGQVKHVLKGHTAKVNAVAIDRQGIRCVTVGDDSAVRVWSLADGSCEQVLEGHGADGAVTMAAVFGVAISSDGTLAATVAEDFSARVWDLDEEECAHVLEGHTGWVVSVAFIGATHDLITAAHDATARVWDGERGRCLHVLSGHEGRLNRVTVDNGGSWAVTCSDDGSARVWELDTGKCIAVLAGHGAWVNDAVITRDGSRVVTVGGDCLGRVWDVATARVECVLEGHTDNLRSVVLTAKGRFAVTASDDCTARVWDLSAINSAPVVRGHTARVRTLATLPDGLHVVSGSEDGGVGVWDATTGRRAHALEGHNAGVAYLRVATRPPVDAKGPRVASGSGDRHVCVWDTSTGALVASLAEQQGSRVKDMAFSADGMRAAVVLFDSSAAVWDVATGTALAQLIQRGERMGRNVHTGGVNGILLSADGATAITYSKDCTARVWDVAKNEVRVVLTGHTDGIHTAALSPDETMLASASYAPVVRLHRLPDGAPLAILDHEGPVATLAFSPDSRFMAAVLQDAHLVVVWDLVSQVCLPPLAGHKGEVTAVVFSPDAQLLATCSADCTLRIWAVGDGGGGRQVAFFMADAGLSSVTWAGAGTGPGNKTAGALADMVVAGDANGMLHFLDFPVALHPSNAPTY